MESNYPDLGNARLAITFFKKNSTSATLNDYARNTNLEIPELLKHLEHFLQEGDISIEAFGGELYLNTYPRRNIEGSVRVFPANLWELLRKNVPVSEAHELYQLYKSLLFSGWVVKIRERVNLEPTVLSIILGELTIPLLENTSTQKIRNQDNLLSKFELNNIHTAAIITKEGELGSYSTSLRSWYLGRNKRSELDIILLEAPRYSPVIVTPDDSAVSPLSIVYDANKNSYSII